MKKILLSLLLSTSLFANIDCFPGSCSASGGGGGTGTVTSVGLSDGSSAPIYSISGSPVISSGTLTFSLNTEPANTVFAGPSSGGAAQPTFRALVSADIPVLGQYFVLAGQAGGQNGRGGTGALENLTLSSTANASKAWVQINDGSGFLMNGDPTNLITNSELPNEFGFAGALVASTGNTNGLILANSGGNALLETLAAKGTFAAPTQFASGNPIFNISAEAYSGSGVFDNQTDIGDIKFSADQAHTTSAMGTRLGFFLIDNGTRNSRERLRIDGAGQVIINQAGVASGTNLIWGLDGSGNIGATASANRPDTVYVKTNVETPLVTGSEAASGNLLLDSTSSATKGFVEVNDGSRVLVDDPTQLMGTTIAAALSGFQVIADAGARNNALVLATQNADTNALAFVSSRGSYSAPTQLVNGYSAGLIAFKGWAGSSTYNNQRNIATINVSATATHTTVSMPSKMVFSTIPTGSISASNSLTYDNTGSLTLASGSTVSPDLLWATDGSADIGSPDSGVTANRPKDIWLRGALRIGENSGTATNAVSISSPASVTPYSLTLPAAQGAASTVLTNNGSGVLSWAAGASGSVTSVALADGSTSAIYSISGSPVTSSGTLTFTLKTVSPNLIFAGPASGANAQPTFRSMVAADVPTAIMSGATAAGTSAIAVGTGATASGTNSTAIGTGASSTFINSTTLGLNAHAFDVTSVAIGSHSTTQTNGTAVGETAVAGPYSVAIGSAANTGNGPNTSMIAIGYNVSVNSQGVIAIGAGSSVAASGTVVGTGGSTSNSFGAAFGTSAAAGYEGTALGYGASASDFTTSVGAVANTPGSSNAVAIGGHTQVYFSNNTTAVGTGANSFQGSLNTLIGTFANSSNASGAVALGYGAHAHTLATAAGYAASVTVANGTAIGGNNQIANASLSMGAATSAYTPTNADGQITFGTSTVALKDMFIGQGAVPVPTPSSATVTIQPTAASGLNVAGTVLTILGGNGTGTGGSGTIAFKTAPTAASSSTSNTYATVGQVTSTGAWTIGASGTTPTHVLNTNSTTGAGVGLLTNVPGAAGNPAGYIQITINGTTSYIPYFQ